MKQSDEIIQFWFEEATPQQWFTKENDFDDKIRQAFGETHKKVIQGEAYFWRESMLGRLAEIIVIDQFSRNLFRNDARSFAYDSMALALAQEAVGRQEVSQLGTNQRAFLYMPYMHSESLLIHETALQLFSEPGMEENLEFEKRHYEILLRFGRYPHRNQTLQRKSTSEELEFLKQPNSSF